MKAKSPVPIFDNVVYLEAADKPPETISFELQDYRYGREFLLAYKGSPDTFKAYRREIERLLQWIYLVRKTSLKGMVRQDIEAFIAFCQNPPKLWIGTKNVARFIAKDGLRKPNPAWRPFLVTVKKSSFREGEKASLKDFTLSNIATKQLFAILNNFFNYLLQSEYITANPILLVRQKNRFIRREQTSTPVRRLSEIQWQEVLKATERLAQMQPKIHERSLFTISILYGMYLRISEVVETTRWRPTMGDFFKDNDNNWWFKTVGKGNKERHIAVSNSLLEALRRYRIFRGLTPLPFPGEQAPLLSKLKGTGGIKETRYVRNIVQRCFDEAVLYLKANKSEDEAFSLQEATVHWLRHTGISDDVKERPLEHVRDDAGHSSSTTTDKYIDIERRARHETAKEKKIKLPEQNEN